MSHAQAHAWLNRLRRAYRYARTPARRAQLDRAVRITTARIYADHVAAAKRRQAARKASRMSAVVKFALAQVGDRYAHGASGPNRWDCSGLVQAAFRRAGIRLPHSSRGIAARARAISRSQARPGDLVIGPGHVGVLVGRRGGQWWMVDAGNPRVGVAHRKIYAGLHIERL